MNRRFMSSGYTLFELLLVLLIASLVTVIAMPGLTGFLDQIRLQNACQQVVSDMYRARFSAVAKNCRYRIRFDVSKHAYRLEEDLDNNRKIGKGEEITPPIHLPDGVRFDASEVKGPPSRPDKTPASPVTFTQKVMSVGPNGMWSNPGAIYLLSPGGQYAVITVAISGRAAVWYWDPERQAWV